MNMPAHPPHIDSEPANAQPRRRIVAIIAVISIVVLLVGIHLLRAALG
jgi:hypothetical protein